MVEEDASPALDLATFIEGNYRLFAVMGVFGSVAVYLSTISIDEVGVSKLVLNIGILASLANLVVVSGILNSRAYHSITDAEFNVLQILFNPPNFSFTLFLLSFDVLAVTVIASAIRFSDASYIATKALAFFVGIWICMKLIFWLIVGVLETPSEHAADTDILVILTLPVIAGVARAALLVTSGYSPFTPFWRPLRSPALEFASTLLLGGVVPLLLLAVVFVYVVFDDLLERAP